MRDYRLWQEAGCTRRTTVAALPAELDEWAGRGWVEHDTRLLERLTALQERALRPDLLGACLR
ncbi:hypothetical protein [Nocardioides daphniae]|uniref:hypothetical protein n=1 Tax=Nocardioides daphniae TaxID=402297 RepID=UPI00193101E5|nr:hypothetical protein [Nocardioides daphniae]